jgi:hypothetical protein
VIATAVAAAKTAALQHHQLWVAAYSNDSSAEAATLMAAVYSLQELGAVVQVLLQPA